MTENRTWHVRVSRASSKGVSCKLIALSILPSQTYIPGLDSGLFLCVLDAKKYLHGANHVLTDKESSFLAGIMRQPNGYCKQHFYRLVIMPDDENWLAPSREDDVIPVYFPLFEILRDDGVLCRT